MFQCFSSRFCCNHNHRITVNPMYHICPFTYCDKDFFNICYYLEIWLIPGTNQTGNDTLSSRYTKIWRFAAKLQYILSCASEVGSPKIPELNTVDACRGFPTDLTPRGWPCCIVRILEECGLRAATRHGARDPILAITTYTKFQKETKHKAM